MILGSTCGKGQNAGIVCGRRIRGLVVRCSNSEHKDSRARARARANRGELKLSRRREVIGVVCGVAAVSVLFVESNVAKGAGLPPDQKQKLCDDACEKELENVW